ncbi:MAG: winged helix-turn-helix domain-containing protein [Hellea sp.]
MQIGQTEIDFEAHQIDGPAGQFSIEPKVMEVLTVLIDNAGKVVTRERLIDQVWGVGFGGDERLSRAISLLRKALGDTRGKHDYIQTIPKQGYKFTVTLDAIDTLEVKDKTKADKPEDIPGDPPMDSPALDSPSVNSPPAISPPADLHSGDSQSADSPARARRRKIRSGLIAALSLACLALLAFVLFDKSQVLAEPPLIMIMDSAHPARIYDEQVKAEGGTNADTLSGILADLPLRAQKELISPTWHRYEAITHFDPDLIVIHYSGFKQEDSSGDRPQLRLLVEYFLKSDTQFLVYSRADHDWLEGNMNIVLKDLYAQHPTLKTRIDIFPLLEYGEPNWKDPGTAQGIKLKIKDMLDLE